MRSYDKEEAKRLEAKPWMLKAMKLNPPYVHWGPGEDYMKTAKPRSESNGFGRDGGVELENVAALEAWALDELNECVHFYFSVEREADDCKACDRSGYAPFALRLERTFYPHGCEELGLHRFAAWNDKITEADVDALWEAGRLKHDWKEKPTAAEVNADQSAPNGKRRSIFGHDAINRHVMIEARCKAAGEPRSCPKCGGHGYTYKGDTRLSLTLWMLHPRKGCSRGIVVRDVKQDEMRRVFAWLAVAAQRNAERFASVVKRAKNVKEAQS